MAATYTWGELLNQARFILQDTEDRPYRYSDNVLLSACHLACVTTKQIRPDLFYGRYLREGEDSACFPAPPYSNVSTTKARLSPFPEIYLQPVIAFIAGYAEVINEEFSDQSRAAALLSTFRAQLKGAV